MILSPGFALSPVHLLFYLLFSTAAHLRMFCALIHLGVFIPTNDLHLFLNSISSGSRRGKVGSSKQGLK